MKTKSFAFLVFVGAFVAVTPVRVAAHCDTMDGPVVASAEMALAKGDVTSALKWVKPEQEAEIRTAFQKTLVVRKQSADAKELADMYFFETLVRLHRASEGESYTGLKPAGTPIEPAVSAADKSITTGKADAIVKDMNDAIAAGIRKRHAEVLEKKKHAEDSVAAGREYVAAYVGYVHYIERLHESAASETTTHHD